MEFKIIKINKKEVKNLLDPALYNENSEVPDYNNLINGLNIITLEKNINNVWCPIYDKNCIYLLCDNLLLINIGEDLFKYYQIFETINRILLNGMLKDVLYTALDIIISNYYITIETSTIDIYFIHKKCEFICSIQGYTTNNIYFINIVSENKKYRDLIKNILYYIISDNKMSIKKYYDTIVA